MPTLVKPKRDGPTTRAFLNDCGDRTEVNALGIVILDRGVKTVGSASGVWWSRGRWVDDAASNTAVFVPPKAVLRSIDYRLTL